MERRVLNLILIISKLEAETNLQKSIYHAALMQFQNIISSFVHVHKWILVMKISLKEK
jgi:hypothetical protein